MPDAALLVVDDLSAVGGGLHRSLDGFEVLIVLGHEQIEAIEPLLPDVAMGHLPVAPVGSEPDDVETGAVDGGGPEHQERKAAPIERCDDVGEDPMGRLQVLGEEGGQVFNVRQQLASVVSSAGPDGRDHVLMAVVEQRDHRAARVKRRRDGHGVNRAGVVHLEESLGHDLPIAVEFDRRGVEPAQRRCGNVGQQRGQRIEEVKQRHGIGVEVDEPPASPPFAADRRQRSISGAQPDEVSFVGNCHQLPAQVIAPRVVLACEPARSALVASHDGRAAMTTRVVERAHLIVLATHHQYRSTGDIAQHIRTGLGQLGLVSRVEPRTTEQPLPLEGVEGRIGVPSQRNVGKPRKPVRRRFTL